MKANTGQTLTVIRRGQGGIRVAAQLQKPTARKQASRQALCRRSRFPCCSQGYFDNFDPAQLETLPSEGRDVAKLARTRPTRHASPHADQRPGVIHLASCQTAAPIWQNPRVPSTQLPRNNPLYSPPDRVRAMLSSIYSSLSISARSSSGAWPSSASY